MYPLAILIAFFSGAWPYIKLVCMFVCWLSPTGVLSVKRRESILQFMDMMGKWSLIDFFVMTMFMCAFYFELALVPQVSRVRVRVCGCVCGCVCFVSSAYNNFQWVSASVRVDVS